jgi:hypothetical protein
MLGADHVNDKKLAKLRKENRILREVRDILKKSDGLRREPKPMRFRFIEQEKAILDLQDVQGIEGR